MSEPYWTLENSRQWWNDRDRLTGLFICNRPAKQGTRLCQNLVKTNLGCWSHRTPRITLDCEACGGSVPREIARDGLCHGCYTAHSDGTGGAGTMEP